MDYAPVRALLGRTKGSEVYPVLRAYYEVCIQHGCSARWRAEFGVSQAEFNRAMFRVGWLRVQKNPIQFLSLAASEYRAFWFLNSRTHPSLAPQFDAFVRAARPLPLEERIQPQVLERTNATRVAYLVRPAFIGIGLLVGVFTVWFGFMSFRHGAADGHVLAAFMAALSVQLVLVFNALTGIGEGRYTMGLWPNIVVALVLGFTFLLRLTWPKVRQRYARPRGSVGPES